MDIKKDWLILLASTIVGLVIGIILFGHATFASAQVMLDYTVNSTSGALDFLDTATNNTISGVSFGNLFESYDQWFFGLYPDESTPLYGTFPVGEYRDTNWDGRDGTTAEGDTQGAGDYWYRVDVVDGGGLGIACVDTPSGTSGWTVTDCEIPPEVISTSTHIISLNSPSDGETTGATTVSFSVDYVSNIPIPDEICIAISGTFQNLEALCSTITSSGSLNFSTSTVLTSGQAYTWYAFIRGIENEIIDQSSLFWFSVVTPQQSVLPSATTSTSTLDSLNLDCDASNFVANSFCNLAVQLLIPSDSSVASLNNALNSLMLKQPFSAFKEFKDGWNNAVRNPTVANGGYTMVFQGENIPILSSSTVYSAIGETTTNNLRAYMSIALWIFFGVGMYLAVTRLF